MCPLRKLPGQTWVKLAFLLDSAKSTIVRRFQNEQGHPLQRLQSIMEDSVSKHSALLEGEIQSTTARMVARLYCWWSYHIHSLEAGRDGRQRSACVLPFEADQDPSLWIATAYSQGGSSHFNCPSVDSSPQACPTICLRGNSGSYEVS